MDFTHLLFVSSSLDEGETIESLGGVKCSKERGLTRNWLVSESTVSRELAIMAARRFVSSSGLNLHRIKAKAMSQV